MEKIYTECDKSQAVFLDNLLSLPRNPYCCDDLFVNLKIRNRASAIKCKYLQLNQSLSRNYMILDIDSDNAAWSYESANVPAPNFVTINKKNGHGHAVYCLHAPVFADKPKSAAFFSDVQKKYVQTLGADPAYSGFLTRNPYAHLIRPIHTRKYTLSELDLDIKLLKKTREKRRRIWPKL